MEQYAFKDVTLRIFHEILEEPEFRDWPDVGIAIQAYLRDTETDLRELARLGRRRRGTPVWVRLVKGAYWDYETVIAAQNGWPVPVWTAEVADRRQLRALHAVPAGELRRGCGRRSAATTSAASRTRWPLAEHLGVPPAAYEFQMLYGMADPIKDVLVGAGPARARLHALRPTAAGHGVPGPPAAGEHVERVVPAGQLHARACPRRNC